MQKTGEPLILDLGDNQITDESLVRKIKRSDEYKNAVRDLSIKLKEETDEQTSEVVNLFRAAPEIQSESSWAIALSELKPEIYDAKSFGESHPTEDDIRTALSFEATRKIRSWKFWQLKRLRREYVDANTKARHIERVKEWSKKKEMHDETEQSTKSKKDREFRLAYEQTKAQIQAAINGDHAYIREALDDLFEGMNMPFDFSIDYEMRGNEVLIDLDLPEIEDMPLKKASILATGKVKVVEKPQKELRSEYARCVTGLGVYVAAGVFNISPKIVNVLISAYTQRPNKATGNTMDEYVYSVRYERDEFADMNFPQIDPVVAITKYEHCLKLSKSFELGVIVPLT